jgi:hypothetical protein
VKVKEDAAAAKPKAGTANADAKAKEDAVAAEDTADANAKVKEDAAVAKAKAKAKTKVKAKDNTVDADAKTKRPTKKPRTGTGDGERIYLFCNDNSTQPWSGAEEEAIAKRLQDIDAEASDESDSVPAEAGKKRKRRKPQKDAHWEELLAQTTYQIEHAQDLTDATMKELMKTKERAEAELAKATNRGVNGEKPFYYEKITLT